MDRLYLFWFYYFLKVHDVTLKIEQIYGYFYNLVKLPLKNVKLSFKICFDNIMLIQFLSISKSAQNKE